MLTTVSKRRDDTGDEERVDAALHALRKLGSRVETVQRQLTDLRLRRDQAIRTAVDLGASERAAAGSAGVSPSYAHLAAKNGGLTAAVLRERRTLPR